MNKRKANAHAMNTNVATRDVAVLHATVVVASTHSTRSERRRRTVRGVRAAGARRNRTAETDPSVSSRRQWGPVQLYILLVLVSSRGRASLYPPGRTIKPYGCSYV